MQNVTFMKHYQHFQKKRKENKWQLYRRQLWMYFYTEPLKLKNILQQIEEEYLKLKADDEVKC